jgi:hypothetical protein
MNNKYNCVICKEEDIVGYGNNPIPLAKSGLCCNTCNISVVRRRISNQTWAKLERDRQQDTHNYSHADDSMENSY